MTLEMKLAMAVRSLTEGDGEIKIVQGLDQDLFDEICLVLRGQSPNDLLTFKNAVEKLLDKGYQLKSIVAELRCSSDTDLPKKWKCLVRPKIGAKACNLLR
jgi:hypothetical protein